VFTSQESFCPFAYPAHKKESMITLEWPAVRNISWHTWFSMIGTCTSCRTDGTPPPYLSRPHPVTVAIRPVKSSPSRGRQIGTENMCRGIWTFLLHRVAQDDLMLCLERVLRYWSCCSFVSNRVVFRP
jgi:hypothetical protein